MSDYDSDNVSKRPVTIGKKPLTIGGRVAGGRLLRPAKDQALSKKTEEKSKEADRQRQLKILENAGDVKNKLRKDAEVAEIRAQQRLVARLKKEKEQEEQKKLAQENERKKTQDKENLGITDLKVVEKKQIAKNKPKSKEFAEEKGVLPKKPSSFRAETKRRQKTKFTVSSVLTEVDESFDLPSGPSLASVRRRREKEKLKAKQALYSQEKIVREVIVPETIRVSDLANRMAERAADVVKELMKLGVVATVNQYIDADTAELIVAEFGHTAKRVSESDLESATFEEEIDEEKDLKPRAPVVAVLGHVDHGKTSLLDALRSTDIAAKEMGGITQHIGAYAVKIDGDRQIIFLDTPGHEAFTQMRKRGANITDMVILVVAADDGIMPQTIEAINHASAAKVPIIVAINKIDKPSIDIKRVQTQLLEHGVQVESLGGDVLCVEVSAKLGRNLDALKESILLQADMLHLRANPDATPRGVIIEAKLEHGRGIVATVLVQKGTVKVGQIFIAGSCWGRVRALSNDRGEGIKSAYPSLPVEVLGWNGIPQAGDQFLVVKSESQAREITQYRQRKTLAQRDTLSVKTDCMEDIFKQIKKGENTELPLIIKTDTQGSLEAIKSSLSKFDSEEVRVNFIHGATGGITESDITLANSCKAVVIGFNVRANAQARMLAEKEGQELRYYSVIYDLIDDIKKLLTGMLAPKISEHYIGHAEVRQVFKVGKLGRVAGCYITDGVVKRGESVRILRDDVVVYEGHLKQLKREKDDVKEVRNSYECGMMFENYDDLKEGDVIECFEIKSEAQEL